MPIKENNDDLATRTLLILLVDFIKNHPEHVLEIFEDSKNQGLFSSADGILLSKRDLSDTKKIIDILSKRPELIEILINSQKFLDYLKKDIEHLGALRSRAPSSAASSPITLRDSYKQDFSSLNIRSYAPSSGASSPLGGRGGGGSSCFIATVAFGSHSSEEVEILRRVRDIYLLNNKMGRKWTDIYYQFGPFLANLIKESSLLKFIAKITIYPVVVLAKYFLHIDINSPKS